MFGVKSVVVVVSILSSGGVLAPPFLWCEVCLYEQQRGSSLCVMYSRILSSLVEGSSRGVHQKSSKLEGILMHNVNV